MGRLAQLGTALLERSLDGLDRLAQRRGRSASLPAHLTTGLAGEDAAFFYLRRKGYTVVARRWSSGDVPGDVDLIAWQGSLLCFIEVKTRTARDMTPAETAVDSHKRATLRRLARRYTRQLPQAAMPPVRFDVISVYLVPGEKREFMHFEAAFGWSEYERRD
jgi:putative endonuclease